MVFSSVDDWLGGPREEAFLDLLRDTRRSRGFGDFWGHMLVARGAADLMMEPALRIWDWASITVIVEEAGGRVTTFEGEEPSDGSSILTTNADRARGSGPAPLGPVKRCEWAPLESAVYLAYHDEEWGVPVHDDGHLFEMLTLEGAQAGLSWSTILNKREGYRRAFSGFDPGKVARFASGGWIGCCRIRRSFGTG